MTNSLEQSLLDILNSTVQTVKDGVSFLSAQIPDVVQQLLTYHFIQTVVWALVAFIIFFILSIYVPKTCKNKFDEHTKDWECSQNKRESNQPQPVDYAFPAALSGMIGLIPGFIFVALALKALKIYIAPKLYLIEYAAALVK